MNEVVLYASCCGLALAGLSFGLVKTIYTMFFAPAKAQLTREIELAGRHWEESSWKSLLPAIKRLARFNKGYEDSKTATMVRMQLEVMGNPLKLTYADFLAACELTALVIAAFGGLLGFGVSHLGGISMVLPVIFIVAGAVIGFFLPFFYLYSDSNNRIRYINKDLPYALDLMLLMIEAGANFQEAFGAVVQEGSYGPLGEELRLVNSEIQHGSTIAEALSNLARRIPSDDLVVIVQSINQGLAMGTPLSNIFRDQSDLLRLKRSQRAEKIAKKAGSMMIFPVILIMMATFLLILGPAVIQMTQGGLG